MAATTTLTVRVVTRLPWVWRHHCGRLNEGQYTPGATCGGCGAYVDDPEDVDGQYLLVEAGA